jgi:hypothetical protein
LRSITIPLLCIVKRERSSLGHATTKSVVDRNLHLAASVERCLRVIIKANEKAAVDVREATSHWALRIIAPLRLNGDEEASRPHISRFIPK